MSVQWQVRQPHSAVLIVRSFTQFYCAHITLRVYSKPSYKKVWNEQKQITKIKKAKPHGSQYLKIM